MTSHGDGDNAKVVILREVAGSTPANDAPLTPFRAHAR
jgi:hypothetical protein